jgi:ribonuclease-3
VKLLDTSPELAALADRIGHEFEDPALLAQAVAHRSWCAEQGGIPSNERLEFLGDSVLGVIVSDHAFTEYPEFSEGEMAKLRAAVVNSAVLARTAGDFDIGPALFLGRGENLSGGREKQSILADAFEAIIGAVYVDGGMAAAERFVLDALGDCIEQAADVPGIDDHKTRLQEAAAREFNDVPDYVITEAGPDHRKQFHATVSIAGVEFGDGDGRSKKLAEQAAARVAWGTFHERQSTESETTDA